MFQLLMPSPNLLQSKIPYVEGFAANFLIFFDKSVAFQVVLGNINGPLYTTCTWDHKKNNEQLSLYLLLHRISYSFNNLVAFEIHMVQAQHPNANTLYQLVCVWMLLKSKDCSNHRPTYKFLFG